MKFSEFKYERINLEEVARQSEELLAELKQQTTAEDFYRVFLKQQEMEKKIEKDPKTKATVEDIIKNIQDS